MESLGRLGDKLPGAEAEEKELQASFRSAALAITGLFKQGKKATNKAYIAGKREALQDVLEFLQTSLDHPSQPAQGPLNVARLIDYICARQETLKAEEEGDDEDDSAGAPNASTSAASRSAAAAARPPSPITRQSFPSPTRPPAPSAPITRPASALNYSQQQPIASTSSSAPSSPAFTRLSPSSFSRPLPPPSHAPFPFTAPSSPLASSSSANTPLALNTSNAGGLAASPLTRSQARQHRSGGARKSRGGNGAAASRERERGNADTPVVVDASGAAAGDGSLSGSMKRRWANVALSEVSLGGGGVDGEGGASESDSEEGDEGQPGGHDGVENGEGAVRIGEDSMEMEMDGWNGLGERPNKRVARTSLR